MSLHLGNLSPRIRKDELERVFRRFGRCTVRLKDGYGFAVYDFHGDAEAALRTLKGRKICGQAIDLSWSNKQPKPLQQFARAARFHDMMQHGRHSDRIDNYPNHDFSQSYGDYSDKRPINGGGRHKSGGLRGDRVSFYHDKDFEHHAQKEQLMEESGHVEPNQVDTGRWGEDVDNFHNDNDVDEKMGFDRYEPDSGDEADEEYETCGLRHLADFSPRQTSLDNKRRRLHHPDNTRGHQTCFKCGAAGHKMRDCPLEGALSGRKPYHADDKHEKEVKSRMRNEVGGPVSKSRKRLQPNSRNSRSTRLHDTDRNLSHSEKNETDVSSPDETESSGRKRRSFNRKRRKESEDETGESLDHKKSRRTVLSHLHSSRSSPKSSTYSRSLKPLPGVNSHSQSRSPLPRSLSVNSRSKSRLSSSRSRSMKSNSSSKSRSHSPPLSLTGSLGQSLHSPPNKKRAILNGSLSTPSSQSKEVLNEVRQLFEHDERENISINNIAEASLNGHADNTTTSPQSRKVLIVNQQLEPDLKENNPTSTNYTEASLNDSPDDKQFLHSQVVLPEEKQWLEHKPKGDSKPPIADMSVQSEGTSSSFKAKDDVIKDQLHNDEKNSTAPHLSSEIKSPCVSLLEQGDEDATARELSAEKHNVAEEPENADVSKGMRPFELANTSEPRAIPSSNSQVGSHLSISSDELHRVLKHYGLKHPDETEQMDSVEDYFGSVRLWPWEMIYYRRLKKGPVSTENYARRVAQNSSFGINDKYVRSSSGWFELIEERP